MMMMMMMMMMMIHARYTEILHSHQQRISFLPSVVLEVGCLGHVKNKID